MNPEEDHIPTVVAARRRQSDQHTAVKRTNSANHAQMIANTSFGANSSMSVGNPNSLPGSPSLGSPHLLPTPKASSPPPVGGLASGAQHLEGQGQFPVTPDQMLVPPTGGPQVKVLARRGRQGPNTSQGGSYPTSPDVPYAMPKVEVGGGLLPPTAGVQNLTSPTDQQQQPNLSVSSIGEQPRSGADAAYDEARAKIFGDESASANVLPPGATTADGSALPPRPTKVAQRGQVGAEEAGEYQRRGGRGFRGRGGARGGGYPNQQGFSSPDNSGSPSGQFASPYPTVGVQVGHHHGHHHHQQQHHQHQHGQQHHHHLHHQQHQQQQQPNYHHHHQQHAAYSHQQHQQQHGHSQHHQQHQHHAGYPPHQYGQQPSSPPYVGTAKPYPQHQEHQMPPSGIPQQDPQQPSPAGSPSSPYGQQRNPYAPSVSTPGLLAPPSQPGPGAPPVPKVQTGPGGNPMLPFNPGAPPPWEEMFPAEQQQHQQQSVPQGPGGYHQGVGQGRGGRGGRGRGGDRRSPKHDGNRGHPTDGMPAQPIVVMDRGGGPPPTYGVPQGEAVSVDGAHS